MIIQKIIHNILFLLCLILVLSAHEVCAQGPITIGINEKVNQVTAGSQEKVAVATNSSGKYIVGWQTEDEALGDQRDIKVAVYNEDRTIAVSEFIANTTTASNQEAPGIAMDSLGNFMVVWMSWNVTNGVWGIYNKVFDKDGMELIGESEVQALTTSNQRFPSVSVNGTSGYIITWENDGDIYARRYDDSGASLEASFIVNTTTAGLQQFADVSTASDDSFVVTWESIAQDSDGAGVYAQRYDNTGAAVGSEIQVNSTTAENQITPKIAMDSLGNYAITWASYLQDGDHYGIYTRLYDNTGTPSTGELIVNTTTAGVQNYPDITMTATGKFFISWTSYDQDGDDAGVYLQAFEETGLASGAENLINVDGTDYYQMLPAIVANHTSLRVVYQDGQFGSTATRDGDEFGVYEQSFAIDNTAPTGYSVVIDQSSINSSNVSAISFTFVSAEVGATYGYTFSSEGGGTDVTGTGTVLTATDQITDIDLSGLSDGTITLAVTLTDADGNTGAIATDTEIKDTTAPIDFSVVIDQSVINNSNVAAVSFMFAGAELGTTYNYTFSSDGGGANVTGSGTITSATDQIGGIDLSGLGDGNITLSVTLTDVAGNTSDVTTDTIVKDTIAPAGHTVVIDQTLINNSNETAVSFMFAGAELGTTYNYTFSSDGGGANVSGSGTITSATDQIGGIDLSGLEDGNITLSVTLTDVAGNISAVTIDTIMKDATPPAGHTVTIDQPLINSANFTVVSFMFAGAELGTTYNYTFSSDGGGANVTGSGIITTATDQITGIDLSGLGDGNITLSVTLTDVAGNISAVTIDTIMKDATPPAVHTAFIDQSVINGSNVSSAGFTFSGAELGTTYNYTFSSDGGGVNVTGSGTITTATDQITGIDLSGLGDGNITLSTTLTDAAGNTNAVTTDTIVKDATPPAVHTAFIDQSVINGSNVSSAGFTFSGAELGTTYNYTFSSDGGGTNVTGAGTIITVTDQLTGIDLSGLEDGNVTLSVTLTDGSGNTGITAIDIVLKDTNAVSAVLSTSVSNPTNVSPIGITITFSESVSGFTLDDLIVSNGTASNLDATSSTVYAAVVTPAVDGIVTIDMAANVVQDAATNGNTAATQISIEYDGSVTQVICQDLTVQLDANGMVTLDAVQIDNGSFDNAGIAIRTLDITSFDCNDIGANNVRLTITDVNGNVGSCTAVVTVEDLIAPTVITQDINVALDVNGQAIITPADIDNGSTDNCAIATRTLDVSSFDSPATTSTTVTLTVTDVNGNSATGTAVVTFGKVSQAIIFNPIADKKVGEDPVILQATGGESGLPVTYSLSTTPASGVATLLDNTLTIEGPGVVVITASQAGNDIFLAAEEVSQTFEVLFNELFLPTLFSPNDDGTNDRFVVRGGGNIASIQLRIFDRESNLVFSSDNITALFQTGWDGSQQPQGAYIWVVNGSFSGGGSVLINGKNTGIIKLVR